MKLKIVQHPSNLNEVEQNLNTAANHISEGIDEGCDLVIFPELFLTGYDLKERVFDLALSKDDLTPLLEVTKSSGTLTVVGFPERGELQGQVFNSAAVISDNIEVYRKIFLPNFGVFEEFRYYTPGSHPYLKRFPWGTLGVEVCYDAFFPELSKYLALKGADLLVIISSAPETSKPYFDRVLPARAVETTTFLTYVNAVGSTEKGVNYFGASRIIDPLGNTTLELNTIKDDIGTVEVDLNKLRESRSMRPVLRDSKLFQTWK